jgi:hypothetical protein
VLVGKDGNALVPPKADRFAGAIGSLFSGAMKVITPRLRAGVRARAEQPTRA